MWPPDGRRRQRSKRAGHSVPAVSTCLSKSRLKWEESQPPLGRLSPGCSLGQATAAWTWGVQAALCRLL